MHTRPSDSSSSSSNNNGSSSSSSSSTVSANDYLTTPLNRLFADLLDESSLYLIKSFTKFLPKFCNRLYDHSFAELNYFEHKLNGEQHPLVESLHQLKIASEKLFSRNRSPLISATQLVDKFIQFHAMLAVQAIDGAKHHAVSVAYADAMLVDALFYTANHVTVEERQLIVSAAHSLRTSMLNEHGFDATLSDPYLEEEAIEIQNATRKRKIAPRNDLDNIPHHHNPITAADQIPVMSQHPISSSSSTSTTIEANGMTISSKISHSHSHSIIVNKTSYSNPTPVSAKQHSRVITPEQKSSNEVIVEDESFLENLPSRKKINLKDLSVCDILMQISNPLAAVSNNMTTTITTSSSSVSAQFSNQTRLQFRLWNSQPSSSSSSNNDENIENNISFKK